MPTTPKLPIDLVPTPGFCIKSSVVNPATLAPQIPPASGDSLLEPAVPIVVPAGRKIFVNICYDQNVPPPPPADEEVIQRAINAQEHDDQTFYVPVVISQPKQELDKVGNPSLVFDCVYNSSVRSRSLKDPNFKIFLVELALQRIEAQTSLVLSRQIGTPNIAAKGKLEPRRVWVPAWLVAGKHGDEEGEKGYGGVKGKGKGERLIEVIQPGDQDRKKPEKSTSNALPKLKGILKYGGSTASSNGAGVKISSAATPDANQGPLSPVLRKSQRPIWSWKKELSDRLRIAVDVPNETPYDAIANSTLDIEPRRLILHIPASTKTPAFDLDLDLSKSDAEIVASAPGPVTAAGIHGTDEEDKMKEPHSTLLLKRQRDFDVDAAYAEWRVAEGQLVVCV
ncbi:hypothetical protein P691DRAFT_808071 [Macrolepiota fuliginosa MF-IS2]|uniref:PIH1 N-terminal domain-containing protein n=1 Tax=Macrolepiota fuliginosa MF-IS2 TaxID=1400762 RepID=A0A9P5XLF7_9AGAR|nr:hypothetical protein P691DRAFT_808071 [Macrolepiota fuliginosa MF-IS2]